ncbi:hypothetical protein BDN70DRAFT_643272 [Pholiota conissans]|uniref:Uncharacterized protein n=1 Tax=Pholiota conissans TaxID=109636 RepID=A0A9P5Z4V9_9AGAR|nr:hypothetical protein BDN70DRAFT_643272 [Pholiota conissans]
MVHLVLSSTKGNQGQRYFPYHGYLGLTPIRIDGVVRTRLDADQKGLPAKAITISVRCYESRIGRVNALHSNLLFDHTHTLWAKQDNVDYEPIANLEFPFRFNLPARIPGFSTAVFVDYRCLWRIEAVLHHAPIVGVGSRQIRHFDLPLVRYDLPPFPRTVSPPFPLLDQETSKRGALRMRYSVNVPKVPIGPLDLISIPIHLQPFDQSVSIRSASVIVERRIILHDIPPTPAATSALPQPPSETDLTSATTPTADETYQELASEPASSSSTLSLGSSVPTITPNSIFPSTPSLASSTTPLIAPPPPPPPLPSAKVIVNPIAGAESSGSFSRDSRGMWSKTLTLQWPAPKSHSRWAIGETISSELVSVKYFVRAKIIVTSAAGTETVDLADEELLIVSTNEAERQLALAKYNEMQDGADSASATASRSKSKSPRRSRPAEASVSSRSAGTIPPSPSLVQTSSSSNSSTQPSAAPSSYPRPKASSSRRPHTSAGPRDRPINFAGGAYVRTRDESLPSSQAGPSGASGTTSDGASGSGKRRSDLVGGRVQGRPDTSHSTSTTSSSTRGASLVSGRNSASFWSTVHSNGVQPHSLTRRKDGKDKDAKGGASGGSVRGGGSTSASSTSGSVSSASSRSRGPRGASSAKEERWGGGDSSSSAAEADMSDHMREWEAELARIEVRSRRSSDLVGFAGKKARVAGGASSSRMAIPVPVPASPVAVGTGDV